ncbi:MAG: hypothetical protein J1D89_00720 [Agathobacter sp.]|nr:hypothetical protein [Agathobacter sp.]
MRKGIRFAALVLASVLLFGGCGTPLYEMTDEEEDLIVHSAAYILAKRNIFQKDGLKAFYIAEEKKDQSEDNNSEHPDETQDSESDGRPSGSGGTGTSPSQGGAVSLAEAIGCKDRLEVTYDKLSLTDDYWEGGYFFLSAGAGNTLAVLEFTLSNPGDEDVELHNYEAGYAFYLSIPGAEHIAEKSPLVASLASYEGTIKAKDKSTAVLIFEISKELADQDMTPKLTMERENTSYSVIL